MARGLDKNTGVPLYHQVREDLKARIEAGEWLPDALIPTENELCREYDVSRITIREAVKELGREGLVHKVQGKGTFVSQPKLEQSLERFYSVTESMRQRGLKPVSRILKVEIIDADVHLAGHLGVKQEDKLTLVSRLRLANQEPFMFETVYVPVDFCPELYLKDIASIPLNDILRQDYGIPLIRAIESFEPVVVDGYEAEMLGIETGSPALLVEHTTFTTNSRIVLFSQMVVRGDRCRYSVHLR